METISLKGRIRFMLRSAEGEVKGVYTTENVITTDGKNFLTGWLAAASQATPWMGYVALGTGTTPASSSDSVMEVETARVAGAVSSSANVWQNQATFGPGVATGAITEAGLLSDASGGTLMAHRTFSPLNKAATDFLEVTWQVTFA